MKLSSVASIAIGVFALAAAGELAAQNGVPKTEAKGSLTLGDKTYKLTQGLAYEVTRFKKKQTVVVLSEKVLDTTKLKQSLAKKGNDESFFPFEAHVKLIFDDKGALVQSGIYADGANIISGGDDNLKITAAIKDGVAKGKAGMVKPDTFFKKTFTFDVEFDVAVLQATAVVPVPQPPVLTKPKPAAGDPVPPALVADKELRFEGKLAKDSPKVLNKPGQIHPVKMTPDKTYVFDLESTEFDAYLRILDAANKELAHDDDSGGKRNARLRFTPPSEGTYQVVATRFGSGQGSYVLKIRVLRAGEEK